MIYDISRLMSVVDEACEAEKDYQEYCRKTRTDKGLSPKSSIWIPSLDGSTAHRLGELCERSAQKWTEIADICCILDINQDLLSAVTKSIRRWEKNHGKYDQLIQIRKDNYAGICLQQYLRNQNDGQFYKSTGRRKAWCPKKQKK